MLKPSEIKDYYERLGINSNASQEEIIVAYRRMCLKWHPDKNHEPDAAIQFHAIREAFETLSDKEKEMDYLKNEVTESFKESDPFLYHTLKNYQKFKKSSSTSYEDLVNIIREAEKFQAELFRWPIYQNNPLKRKGLIAILKSLNPLRLFKK